MERLQLNRETRVHFSVESTKGIKIGIHSLLARLLALKGIPSEKSPLHVTTCLECLMMHFLFSTGHELVNR